MIPADMKFCPRCGADGYEYRDGKYWLCPACSFTYFHNVAVSASVIVAVDGAVLMLERAKEPRKGFLSLPGGFVDPDERAEDAACRECREETGLEASGLCFVGSWPNDYAYKDVRYKTCDFYFSASVGSVPGSSSLDNIALDPREAASWRLVSAEELESAPIAFESHRRAIKAFFEAGRASACGQQAVEGQRTVARSVPML